LTTRNASIRGVASFDPNSSMNIDRSKSFNFICKSPDAQHTYKSK
jgi:hypothetical protein